MRQAGAQLVPTGVLQGQAAADAAAEGPQVLAPEEIGQAAVAGQHDAEQGPRVEVRAGEQPQFVEDQRRHLLGFVDQQHGAQERVLQMRQPPLAQGLEPVPAVVRREGDAEEIAELAVEVGHGTLRMRERADGEVAHLGEPLGEQAQHDALAGAGLAGDEREAALAHVALLDAPAEGLDLGRREQRLGGDLRGEGIPLETVQGQELLGHGRDSSSGCGSGDGRYAGGRPVAAYSAMSCCNSGAIVEGDGAGSSRAGAAAGSSRRRRPSALAVLSSG